MRSHYSTARLLRAVAIAGALLSGHSASAGLTWEKTEVILNATPFDKELIAEFPFKNTGDKPVKIVGMRSNCGCTTAILKKTEYAPGESGVIAAKFEIGVRMGEQKKPILVRTDDPHAKEIGLYLVARIPQVITMSQSFALWREGESRDKKTLSIATSPDYRVKDVVATLDNKKFTVEIERASATEFRLHVTPVLSTGRGTATVQLVAELESGEKKRGYAYLQVR
jgi:hypothetical protein